MMQALGRAVARVAIALTMVTPSGCPSDETRARPGDRAGPVEAIALADPPQPPPQPQPQPRDAAATEGPRVVVLGVAQDAGVPQAGCDCERCRAAAEDPARRRRVASLALVLPDGRVVLIDATPDLPGQLREIAALRSPDAPPSPRRPVDAILLTHGHMGHYLGLAHLGFEAAHADRVPVHGTARMLTLLREHAPWSLLVEREEIELHELRPGEALDLAGVRVIPMAVPHRAELTDTVGYRIEGPRRTVLYVPDCHPWPRWEPEARESVLDGVDVALLDGTFHSGDELPGRDLSAIGHPLIVDTMAWLGDRSQTPEVRFIHLNHSNPALTEGSEARREIERRGFSVARRGESIPL